MMEDQAREESLYAAVEERRRAAERYDRDEAAMRAALQRTGCARRCSCGSCGLGFQTW